MLSEIVSFALGYTLGDNKSTKCEATSEYKVDRYFGCGFNNKYNDDSNTEKSVFDTPFKRTYVWDTKSEKFVEKHK